MRHFMSILLTSIFIFSNSSYATNWVDYNDKVSVDTDSIMVLNNPKRVTFTTKFLTDTGSLQIGLGIKCHSGKQYISRGSVYDSKGNYLRGMQIDTNVDEDLSPGLTQDMYKEFCLKK